MRKNLETTADLVSAHSGLVILIVSIAVVIGGSHDVFSQTPTGFELLDRGINYGNMLEAPREGEWGVHFNDDYPRLIKAAGFNSVRIPVRWSAHLSKSEPFEIDPVFLNRVSTIVDSNLAHGLNVILNVHHFEELYADPAGQREQFLAVWRQLSKHFQHANADLFFELLNEPHDKLTHEQWNGLLAEAIQEIRTLHATRWIIAGPDDWNSIKRLSYLELPEQDRHLIVTVHYYLPFAFTHQGAEWVRPSPPIGTGWKDSQQEQQEIQDDFSKAAEWAKKHHRPMYLGEFGAYSQADMESRVRWTRRVRKTSEASGFAWAYWELAAGFGILDPATKQWRQNLLEALIDP